MDFWGQDQHKHFTTTVFSYVESRSVFVWDRFQLVFETFSIESWFGFKFWIKNLIEGKFSGFVAFYKVSAS